MASLGGEQQISSNNQEACKANSSIMESMKTTSENAEPVQRSDSREGSIERKVAHNNKYCAPPPIISQTMESFNASSSSSTLHWFAQVGGGDDDALQVSKDRDEKLRLTRERQNEERQRKIEELKAQAEAAQRYREQKEEERRRRFEEIRSRESEKRHQVEERKRVIMEAEKERREYILRKNQERESKLETKKRDKSSYGFAFGSSTPRLLEPDFGLVSPSTFWGHRRSTSISNVAGASLSRRSSERELADSGSKKRATSASGTDRHDDHRRKSSSMYEVLNWGYSNDEPPKRFSLSIVGSEINIDEPPLPPPPTSSSIRTFANTNNNNTAHAHKQYSNHLTTTDNDTSTTTNHITTRYSRSATKEDNVDTSQIVFRSVARRKTDLMPTIPSPRDGHGHHFGSRSSLSTTPRTPVVRAYSMNRLDQLAQPIRRNGEHIRAILERERREQMEMLDETESLGGGRRRTKKNVANTSSASAGGGDLMSRSMTHLAGTSRGKYSLGGGISTNFRPLGSGAAGNRDTTCKSSRSGNVTPGGSINASRPGSAMSTSTTMSTSGLVARRSAPAMRKPRPASIAGTGVSLEELNKHKREHKPPVKNSTPPSSSTSAQNTPKRTSNMMSTSLIVTSSSARLSSAEKRTPAKREPVTPKASTPKPLSKTSSSDRLNRSSSSKEKPKDNLPASMAKSAIVATSTPLSSAATNNSNNSSVGAVPADKEKTNHNVALVAPVSAPAQSKDEKNALNAVKTEEVLEPITVDQTAEPQLPKPDTSVDEKASPVAADDEKIDQGNEKNETEKEVTPVVLVAAPTPVKPAQNGGSKENSVARELTPPGSDGNDLMTASMIAKSKITTEEEAKAALAERRRMARVEAERQAELERQRVEAERLAEIKRQEEEVERQRLFEEESTRLAELQRKGEEERLRQAIEEAKQREEEERLKREEEERQRVEREEAEKKAKEEAEKQKIEVAERLKREEKEREERRKRVEAIMSRTRKAGGGGSASGTPNSTPSKENIESSTQSTSPNDAQQSQQQPNAVTTISSENSSTSGSSTTTTATTPIPAETTTTNVAAVVEPQNTQAMYEQSVIDKETALINSFSNMIIDENAKNLQQQQIPQQPQQQIVEVTNGKLLNVAFTNTDALLQNSTTNNTTTTTTVANGNGHIENINNKNDINILQDVVVPATNQLIDLSIESQDINNAINFNNNNSLLTTTNTLVTADSHEHKDISLL